MKHVSLRAAAVAAAAAATWTLSSTSFADNVVMTQQPPQPQPQPTAPPVSGPTVVNNSNGTPASPPVSTTQTTAAPAPVVVNAESSRPHAEREEAYPGPNTSLLWSGAVMLAISYGTAAVVGGASTLSTDRDLLIPVVGPWVDLAERPHCGSSPGERSCDGETAAKVMIGIDGVFQGLGALQMVGAFIWPGHRTVTTTTTTTAKALKPELLRVGPTKVGAYGYGLGAIGTF